MFSEGLKCFNIEWDFPFVVEKDHQDKRTGTSSFFKIISVTYIPIIEYFTIESSCSLHYGKKHMGILPFCVDINFILNKRGNGTRS